MSINNSPGGMNDQLLDGNHNVLTWIDEVAVPPAVDAVEEFKVQSGSMSAEFGFTAGGVVNLVTKSGANAFHGTVYEFLRNDKLDARNTFAVDKERLRYNQFGGSLGGAIEPSFSVTMRRTVLDKDLPGLRRCPPKPNEPATIRAHALRAAP
jgi:hypothetical protein